MHALRAPPGGRGGIGIARSDGFWVTDNRHARELTRSAHRLAPHKTTHQDIKTRHYKAHGVLMRCLRHNANTHNATVNTTQRQHYKHNAMHTSQCLARLKQCSLTQTMPMPSAPNMQPHTNDAYDTLPKAPRTMQPNAPRTMQPNAPRTMQPNMHTYDYDTCIRRPMARQSHSCGRPPPEEGDR